MNELNIVILSCHDFVNRFTSSKNKLFYELITSKIKFNFYILPPYRNYDISSYKKYKDYLYNLADVCLISFFNTKPGYFNDEIKRWISDIRDKNNKVLIYFIIPHSLGEKDEIKKEEYQKNKAILYYTNENFKDSINSSLIYLSDIICNINLEKSDLKIKNKKKEEDIELHVFTKIDK